MAGKKVGTKHSVIMNFLIPTLNYAQGSDIVRASVQHNIIITIILSDTCMGLSFNCFNWFLNKN